MINENPAPPVSATISDDAFRLGRGNWNAWMGLGRSLEPVLESAVEWNRITGGADRLWLCWNVNSDWCVVQQRLVKSVGWTPLVGGDPRATPPVLIPGALYIDFNKRFGFEVLFPHFVIDFAHLYASRLAFWHSDLLLRPAKMERYAATFAALPDGHMAAVITYHDFWTRIARPNKHRAWELLGCTTKGAAAANFEAGCGWWLNFAEHPNCPSKTERERRGRYHWEYGTGIMYWHRKLGGPLHKICLRDIEEGHCTRINNPNYKSSTSGTRRDLTVDLARNFDLAEECGKLGIPREMLGS